MSASDRILEHLLREAFRHLRAKPDPALPKNIRITKDWRIVPARKKRGGK